MSDFTIRVFRPTGTAIVPTKVQTVGHQLKVLADELENHPANSGSVVRTSEIGAYDPNAGDWTPTARMAIETLFDALSFTLWNGDTVSREVSHNEPNKDVHDHIKLVFVFEEEGHMVVPVPTKANIARGENLAPLRLPADYDMLVSEGSVTKIEQRLRTLISESEGQSDLGLLSDNQVNTIVAAIGKIADEMRAEIDKDVAVFNAQLGDYSVRQCAG
ncbi:MAG: hypothetical protein ABJM43_20400 [Paracoccaceae bacterium]